MIANSPAFRSGKKPLGACAMKYAMAMSPARMNATGRVNKPSTISTPPTSSIMPLMPESDMGATPVEGETGFRRPVLQKQQADDDAQDTQHTWGPCCEKAVDRRHHNFSYERPEALSNPHQTPRS